MVDLRRYWQVVERLIVADTKELADLVDRIPLVDQVRGETALPFRRSDELFATAAAILTTHDYNQYFNIAGSALANAGVSTSCANIATVEPRSMCGDPKFVSTSPPYAATNFKLQATSPVLARGAVIGSFTTDYYGNLRGLSWDKGAIQLTGVGSVGIPPGPPSNLVVQ